MSLAATDMKTGLRSAGTACNDAISTQVVTSVETRATLPLNGGPRCKKPKCLPWAATFPPRPTHPPTTRPTRPLRPTHPSAIPAEGLPMMRPSSTRPPSPGGPSSGLSAVSSLLPSPLPSQGSQNDQAQPQSLSDSLAKAKPTTRPWSQGHFSPAPPPVPSAGQAASPPTLIPQNTHRTPSPIAVPTRAPQSTWTRVYQPPPLSSQPPLPRSNATATEDPRSLLPPVPLDVRNDAANVLAGALLTVSALAFLTKCGLGGGVPRRRSKNMTGNCMRLSASHDAFTDFPTGFIQQRHASRGLRLPAANDDQLDDGDLSDFGAFVSAPRPE